MSKKEKLGLFEAYEKDPIKADLEIFGREPTLNRRGFLTKTSLLTFASIVGSNIPFSDNYPSGLIPAALADMPKDFSIEGKDGLFYFNDKPLTAETPAHLLDSTFTEAKHMFIRNNGTPPLKEDIDPKKWTLEITGESCEKPTTFTLDELKKKFKHYTYALVIECGGNGRSEYTPATSGTQWTLGAIGCGRWTGVRLKDVLKECGIKDNAIYVGYYGADTRLDGGEGESISRGIPIRKAMQDEVLIAWAYENQDIPYYNGHPLRLVVGGYPGSTSGKWLKKLTVRDRIHDGAKMTGSSYRMPCNPVAPGKKVENKDMCIIESMPVKSVVTSPKTGGDFKLAKALKVRGKAWAGDLSVSEVSVSIDFGETWIKTKLKKPLNKLAWQEWETDVKFPKTGYYEIWAKATDSSGKSQPMVLPGWNPKGYLNNACHRIAVKIV